MPKTIKPFDPLASLIGWTVTILCLALLCGSLGSIIAVFNHLPDFVLSLMALTPKGGVLWEITKWTLIGFALGVSLLIFRLTLMAHGYLNRFKLDALMRLRLARLTKGENLVTGERTYTGSMTDAARTFYDRNLRDEPRPVLRTKPDRSG